MMRPGEALATVQTFFDAYLVQRDWLRTSGCLTDDVQWIGIGHSAPISGRGAVEQALREKIAQGPGRFRVAYDRLEERPLSSGCAAVLLTAMVGSGQVSDDAADMELRVTALCTAEGDSPCRIASIHVSVADTRQGSGDYFPASYLSREELERQIGTRALDILGRSIPGGILGGCMEPGFPLYFINDGMLAYLGYTYDEFVSATGGKIINCIHPDDRALVDTVVSGAGDDGREFEIQYRMQQKDGSYLWVNNVGKCVRSDDGRDICFGAIRDISQELESKRRLEERAEEQKRQAEQYDSLFQSVLCGIVQYHLTGRGVAFKKANREAIRIFGYEPEAFWAKEDWDLPALIAEEDRAHIMAEIGGLKEVGDKSTYEYRLLRRDGQPCWIIGSAELIRDSDGTQAVQSVFLDIDSKKKAEERNQRLTRQVEASNELFRLALEHTTTCEFYYYPQTGICNNPERTCRYYGCNPVYADMPRSFAEHIVDPEDWPAYYQVYERIHQGARTASTEFRTRDGKYWCRTTLSLILSDEDGTPQLVIGIVEDITRQKEMEQALQDARSRDSLTGLYNKDSGIRMVQADMARRAPEDHAVLMLLDMDDFERINREEGGVFADAILQEVADILRSETSPDDIQIRLGGDEFMLYIKHSDKAHATIIGPRIAEQVRGIFVGAEKDFSPSVSVGMCSTEVVEDYNALYRCAESTLKYVKEHGKGQAACYLDTSNELGVFLTQLYTEEHQVNAIDRVVSHREEDLVSFALELLGKSKNLDDAVFLLLARIGKTFRFDRVSILEVSREYLSYRFTYQWAKSPGRLQLGEDFYISAEELEAGSQMYDEEGLCEHNLREDISDIVSCLHAGIWNYGDYVGSMSFEVDEPDYRWSAEQRKLLKELVKIVPSFIMKAKADAVSQAKTDFLSRMSHEIRTPMNAISGMTTIAKSVLDDKARALECLEKIESANGYLLSLINDILDMSRIESGKLELNYEPMDLACQMDSLEALLRPQAMEKHLAMQFENAYTENRPLLADGLRLNQVLVNIIGNAVKFTGAGGRIAVRVIPVPGGDGRRVFLHFSVSDTGVGIEESARERIFNPFEQAEKSTAARHGGTGLGLSISSRLVQMMGGCLEVKSQVGQGSEFYFTLPFDYAPEDRQPVSGQPHVSREWDFHGRELLLAEDNELNREIAQTILEMNGFTVTCAADGREALERYQEREPNGFDAILMDIRMPVMDGLEATRRIRTSGRSDARTIPIIALTANAFDEDTKKSMDSGMTGHLSKPIQVEQMLELLGECLERRGEGRG